MEEEVEVIMATKATVTIRATMATKDTEEVRDMITVVTDTKVAIVAMVSRATIAVIKATVRHHHRSISKATTAMVKEATEMEIGGAATRTDTVAAVVEGHDIRRASVASPHCVR
jgi:hypothetical protein